MKIFSKKKNPITLGTLKENWIHQLLLEEHNEGLIETGEYINPVSLN